MTLSELLSQNGVDPASTLVLRHRPTAPAFRRLLPWLAQEKPDLFNMYQSTQGLRCERAMSKATHVVSCIGLQARKALFIGVYQKQSFREIDRAEHDAIPENQEIFSLGANGWDGDRERILLFSLLLTETLDRWKGKLVVSWPPPELSWYRWADRNTMDVLAIHEESVLARAMPSAEEIDLTWSELSLLPPSWSATLAQWRGVYLIFDTEARLGYVGSASGADNLIGRWRNYAASGHGGNRLLLERDPRNFRFSILQLLAQTASQEEVGAVEQSWKRRLHTFAPLGLNDN